MTYIYFIESHIGRFCFVKIGISKNPQRRFTEIQKANAGKLRLLYCKIGSKREEISLHALFSDFKEHGEWFRKTGKLKQYIDRQIKDSQSV